MRFAILGAGRIGQVHAGAIASVPGSELAAVADAVPAAAQSLADAHGCDTHQISKVYLCPP